MGNSNNQKVLRYLGATWQGDNLMSMFEVYALGAHKRQAPYQCMVECTGDWKADYASAARTAAGASPELKGLRLRPASKVRAHMADSATTHRDECTDMYGFERTGQVSCQAPVFVFVK